MINRVLKPPAASIAAKAEQVEVAAGSPLMISLGLIDEDPGQPRGPANPGFSPDSIAELAASYGAKGPKTPISLRDHPQSPGRYIINHGHRRYRAAKVKKLSAIPCFIDNDYNEIDQVIENLQRNELTAREIADWIGREMSKGIKKADIAKSIGKSAAFVSQHATLLDLPDPIVAAISDRKVNDVTVINELAKAFKRNSAEVITWLSDEQQEMTRGSVRLLREYLEQKECPQHETTGFSADHVDAQDTGIDVEVHSSATHQAAPIPAKLRKSIVVVEQAGRPARLDLMRRPTALGLAWLRYEDDGEEAECDLAQVRLVALLEGNI